MPKKNHEWDFDNPAKVSRHTLHKHQVYEDYIKRYIDTVIPHQGDRVVFSIIDGFCGGGIYQLDDTSEISYGSPVRIIEAVRNKAKEINSKRTKPLKFVVQYFFIDSDKKAINCLKRVFSDRGIEETDGEKIHIEKGDFINIYPKIKESIERSLKGKIGKHKAIFILDQYAYKEVPVPLTNQIMSEFIKAEILLTFVPRAFLDFAGKYDSRALIKTNKQLNKLGFDVSINDIREKAQEQGGDMFIHSEQLFLQESIASIVKQTSTAKHFSKYFIQFEEVLLCAFKEGKLNTDLDVFRFSLENGFLPVKHAKPIVTQLIKDGVLVCPQQPRLSKICVKEPRLIKLSI